MTRRKPENPEDEQEKDVLLAEVGKRVREVRHSRKMSQHQAAEVCGVPQTLIFQTEAGVQNLQLRTLAKLAKGLETTVRDLMPVSAEIVEQEKPPPRTLVEVLEKLERVTQEAARLGQLATFLLGQTDPTPQQPPQGNVD